MKKKNKKRKLAAIIIMLCMCFIASVTSYADSSISNANSGYIHFSPETSIGEPSRLNPDGSFTFYFNYAVTSDRFKVTSTSIRIDTCAWLSSVYGISYDSTRAFTLTLYKALIIGSTVVGSYTGYADGIYGGLTFNGLSTSDTYFFVLGADPNFHLTAYHFEGYGNVSNMYLV